MDHQKGKSLFTFHHNNKLRATAHVAEHLWRTSGGLEDVLYEDLDAGSGLVTLCGSGALFLGLTLARRWKPDTAWVRCRNGQQTSSIIDCLTSPCCLSG